MDGPLTEVELVLEKEKIEDGKGGLTFVCDLYDTFIVHKIAQEFLPGLATACVDNTTGDMFRSPGSVAVDVRNEMIDYLTQRSENFVAESVVTEGGPDAEVSNHPRDIISDFVDDFASAKRNFFSQVSGWLLSEKREDKIDDFVQEMEINGFWLLDRREAIAQVLLKNVDFKNKFHCDMKFSTSEALAEHVSSCGFRTMNCTNEGCSAIFCASHVEKHDSVCPFKIIPCEQKCSDDIMRREMDRHCITVCPMKLVNCPFYAVGCQSSVPRCMTQEHNSDDLHSHLLCILKNIHRGASTEDLKQRVDQLVQASSVQLAEARDVRSLTLKVKDLETKLGPLETDAAERKKEQPTEAANNINDENIKI
uniref:TRAF-type domain-containing protein n=1 Tax=Rhizophora mucronata TaxID=61149 RepID=A0A2P2NLX8_RHIMU